MAKTLKQILEENNIHNNYKWIQNFQNFKFPNTINQAQQDKNHILLQGKQKNTTIGILINLKDNKRFLTITQKNKKYTHHETYNKEGIPQEKA